MKEINTKPSILPHHGGNSLCTGPVGWIAGAVFLSAEVFSYAFTGQSVGDNLDQKINWRYNKNQ